MTISPGTRIKELRTLAEMSQEELGRRVGVQRAAINKYEKGSVTNIPIQTIERIASTFDVSPAYILGWNGDEQGNPLSAEVKIIQGVSKFFGRDSVDVLESYASLNTKGRKRIIQYLDDLTEIPRYKEDL